jgi:hypothetical protein
MNGDVTAENGLGLPPSGEEGERRQPPSAISLEKGSGRGGRRILILFPGDIRAPTVIRPLPCPASLPLRAAPALPDCFV